MLEHLGLGVDAIPRHVERHRQVGLQQPVVADHLERERAPAVGELDALVRRVRDEALLRELADHGRGRRGRDVHPRRERGRGDLAVPFLERVDRFRVVLHGGRVSGHNSDYGMPNFGFNMPKTRKCDSAQSDAGAGRDLELVADDEPGHAGDHGERGREADDLRQAVREVQRGGRRREDERDEQQVAEALDGGDRRDAEDRQQREIGPRRPVASNARDAPASGSAKASATSTPRLSTTAAIRSWLVTPSRSPNSSSPSRGGVSGESARMPPSPNSPETTTATPTSPRTSGDRGSRRRARPAAAPKISGSPASAAITSPGSIAWLSDSAAYERLQQQDPHAERPAREPEHDRLHERPLHDPAREHGR